MSQQISTNTFGVAKWVVSPDATQGNFTTIQAAINAASSGDNIFVRPGTYTEDLTLKAGVNLTGLRGDGKTPTVTIIGNCTHNTAGTVSIADFKLQTNGSFCISNTGTLVSIINVISCVINATNNTAISFTNSNAAAQINVVTTAIDLGTTGIAIYSMSSAGTLAFRYCNTTNTGGSSTASASSNGTVTCLYTNLLSPISTSGTAVFNNMYSSIDTSAQNATCQTSTGSGSHAANYSSYSSGTASALSIGGTSTQTLSNATVTSSNVNAITGAGSGILRYSLLRFSGSSAGINVPTITPFVAANLIGTTINVSTDANASTINLGTGAAVKTVQLGSTNGASITAIKSGSAGITLATSTNGTIGLTSGSGAISIGQGGGTGVVNIGNTTGNTQVTGSLTATTTLTASSGAITASSGNVVLTSGNLVFTAASASTTSSITQQGFRLMHTFGTGGITDGNLYIGKEAGNYTSGGATFNTAVGYQALKSITGVINNDNTAVGTNSLTLLTSGIENVGCGAFSFSQLATGSYNCALGLGAANAYTGAESSNICIGNRVSGTLGESNVLRIGSATGTGNGQINKAVICGINGKSTSAGGAVAIMDINNIMGTVAGGIVSLNTGTNALSISTDASATTVNIATGGAAKVVTVGSTNGASSLALQTGTADFSLASATGTIISALDTGEMTFPLQSAFLGYIATSDLNRTGTGTTYTIGTNTAFTEVFDQNSDFNTNGTFTAPVTGRYMLSAQVTLTGCTVNTGSVLSIVTSNRTYRQTINRVAAATDISNSLTVLADMDAGDTATVTIAGTGEAGDTDDILGSATVVTYFSGHLAC